MRCPGTPSPEVCRGRNDGQACTAMILVTKFDVVGLPAPQGSKAYLGKGRFRESSKHLPAWRNDVREAAGKAFGEALINGPVFTYIEFRFPRPKNHYVNNDPSRDLKSTAPRWHFSYNGPDLDKLQRGTNDALTGVIWVDDGQVAGGVSTKVYGGSGATIAVYSLTEQDRLRHTRRVNSLYFLI